MVYLNFVINRETFFLLALSINTSRIELNEIVYISHTRKVKEKNWMMITSFGMNE